MKASELKQRELTLVIIVGLLLPMRGFELVANSMSKKWYKPSPSSYHYSEQSISKFQCHIPLPKTGISKNLLGMESIENFHSFNL